jgi:hypothetical protein
MLVSLCWLNAGEQAFDVFDDGVHVLSPLGMIGPLLGILLSMQISRAVSLLHGFLDIGWASSS